MTPTPGLREAVARDPAADAAATPVAPTQSTGSAPEPPPMLSPATPALRLDELGAVIFDMDGVVTDTAAVHAAAWKRLFDAYLEQRSRETGEPFRPFDIHADYREHVDGKPRYDGVRDFLHSRCITLPEGEPGDGPDAETVRGLGNRKDRYFLEHIRREGVQPYPGTVELVHALHAADVGVAVISASRNLEQVLDAAGVAELFAVRVGGLEAERLDLPGKPDPAVFLEAAKRLGVDPSDAAIVEDALAGVEAGRRGGFRLVVGVDRSGYAEALRARGAHVVVRDPGELLGWQGSEAGRTAGEIPEPTADPAWLLEVLGFDALDEREVESWLSVGNGRTGTRGSVEEGSEESDPATFVAGIYGSSENQRVLVNGPSWTRLRPRVGGEPVDLDRGTTLEHRRLLDLRHGTVYRFWRQRLPSGSESTFRSSRFASLADRDLLVLEAGLEATDGQVELDDGVSPPAPHGGLARYEARFEPDVATITVEGRDGGMASFAVTTEAHDGGITRLVAVRRSLDAGASPASDAEAAVRAALARGAAELRDRHRAAWLGRWRDADVMIEGDLQLQRAVRFGLYHLISAADPESDVASVGARGLSGRGYNGHVFWDTEVFILPFFTATHPTTARALLEYRYRTLDAARARAAALGYRGALFAWESADTGEDVTPTEGIGAEGVLVKILTGEQEHHIAADVAWAIWRYWESTGDDAFLVAMGAEIVLETARFWASRARLGDDGRHHIDHVIGPDEYHEDVNDNAFTNVMARWTIERALELDGILRGIDGRAAQELWTHLGLSDSELADWKVVATGLVDGFDPATGLYEQFAGFFDLEDVRAVDVAPRPFDGHAALGAARVAQAQVVKQPDVLMLAHMLPEVVPLEVLAANYDYYEPRTSHGSSLSPAIHASLAARLGRCAEAVAYLRMSAAIDLSDGMGNAAHGVHVAAMGGQWQAATFGFGGLEVTRSGVALAPHVPDGWAGLRFAVHWHGARIDASVTHEGLALELDGPVAIALAGGAARELAAGAYSARRTDNGWADLEAAP